MMPRQPSVPKVISAFATVVPIVLGYGARRPVVRRGRGGPLRPRHFADDLLEADLGPPAEPGASFARVATQVRDFGRTEVGAIDLHVLLPVEPGRSEER